jgi:ABC-type polysaccharide/polyol phosphate transport system ATPase subunit
MAGGAMAIEVDGLGIEYDLWLSRHRTLRQTLSDAARRSRTQAPRFWALRDVSFTLRCGESLGVIGDNGCGKSTLLLALAGILRPDTGSVATHGTTSTLLTLGAGFEPTLSGRENIYLNAAFLGTSRRFIEERIDDIVEFADIGAFIDVPVSKYSSGMRARLGFSIACHIDPDILLLDEVLAVGDLAFRARSEARLREFSERAKAIVIVSHSMPFIRQACTQALWLDGGRVQAFGEPEEVVRAYTESSPQRAAAASARPRV